MKVADLLNVLAHIPSEIEVDVKDLAIKFEHGVVSAEEALKNLLEGKSVAPAAPVALISPKSDET